MEAGATTILTNTVLAYSPSGGNCKGAFTAEKFSFSSDNSCGFPSSNTIKGNNPNNLDPLLGPLSFYGGPTLVHMPKVTSPAKDGVVGNDAPLVDQRGQPRPGSDGSYDIGAVEREPWDVDFLGHLLLPIISKP